MFSEHVIRDRSGPDGAVPFISPFPGRRRRSTRRLALGCDKAGPLLNTNEKTGLQEVNQDENATGQG